MSSPVLKPGSSLHVELESPVQSQSQLEAVDPIDYFNAWKLESNMPYLVMAKVS